MENFHELMRNTMDRGQDQYNVRTGKVCRTLVGAQVQFSLAEGFPAITSKKLAFDSCKGELLGFFRGYTSAAQFRALGCKVWDANANETEAWLANPYRQGTDDLGRIYGAQWTDWTDRRVASTPAERDRLLAKGYRLRMRGKRYEDGMAGKTTEWLMERSINQLEEALRKLLADPSDRRIIVSGWNVAELDMMALPPCHMDYRFVALDGAAPGEPKTLHVVMTIRSWDEFLGGPFNCCGTALFLAIMARLAGMTPGTVTIQATNAHLYADHFDQVREQLSRPHLAPPALVLSDRIRAVTVAEIPGVFARIEPDDIRLEGYQSYGALPAPMAA